MTIFLGLKRLQKVLCLINSGKYYSEKYWKTWNKILHHHKIDQKTSDAILNGYIKLY